MSGPLPPSASVTQPAGGRKLTAPAAARNADAICDLLRACAPQSGQALELASGTGEHVVRLAAALPGLDWQPTDVDPARLASIDAHAAEAALANLRPARRLDACAPGWGHAGPARDLILLINLLHLVTEAAARTVIDEAADALAPGGRLVIYGPFRRDGALTSPGDQRFDADLRQADPAIGYKDDRWIKARLEQAGLTLEQTVAMPANNLAFVARARG